jgi:pimeloyl-ACP methyl ester carboxylesterase
MRWTRFRHPHVAELPAVVAALRTRLPGADGPVGLLGWSAGAMVALLALAERKLTARAVVLVRPVVQLERPVEADPRRGEPAHRPAAAAHPIAERFDFLARAPEIAEQDPQPAVLVAAGVGEDPPIGEPAERLWSALADRYQVPSRVALLLTPELAPRRADLTQVDTAVTDWFTRHLSERLDQETTMH